MFIVINSLFAKNVHSTLGYIEGETKRHGLKQNIIVVLISFTEFNLRELSLLLNFISKVLPTLASVLLNQSENEHCG